MQKREGIYISRNLYEETLSRAEEPSFRAGGCDRFFFLESNMYLHFEGKVIGSHPVVQTINIILDICIISIELMILNNMSSA